MGLVSLDCIADGTCVKGFTSGIDCALAELSDVYQERLPYELGETITGQCVNWSDTFISLCRYAMSTDCMTGMSSQEKAIWRAFVDYEDAMTTSPDTTMCMGLAVGCTVPDVNGDSFAVCADLTVSTEECLPADANYPKEYLYYSLDQHFMALVNCEVIDGCECSETIELDIGDCEQCGEDYPTCPDLSPINN